MTDSARAELKVQQMDQVEGADRLYMLQMRYRGFWEPSFVITHEELESLEDSIKQIRMRQEAVDTDVRKDA